MSDSPTYFTIQGEDKKKLTEKVSKIVSNIKFFLCPLDYLVEEEKEVLFLRLFKRKVVKQYIDKEKMMKDVVYPYTFVYTPNDDPEIHIGRSTKLGELLRELHRELEYCRDFDNINLPSKFGYLASSLLEFDGS